MHNLTTYEEKALEKYYESKQINQNHIIVIESQRILENLFRQYCEAKYSQTRGTITEVINKILNVDTKFIKNPNEKGMERFKRDHRIFLNHFYFINNSIRNPTQHDGYEPTSNEAKNCRDYTKKCLIYYFTKCLNVKYEDIKTTNTTCRLAIDDLFNYKNKTEEVIEREKYYVLLLIDSSASMQWPYDEKNNGNKTLGIKDVQKAMSLAHDKTLGALRRSSACLNRCMYVYQYTFNHNPKVLNGPELLSPFENNDNVKIINHSNYTPDGATALYKTIEESLMVIYNNYLKPAKENEHRIDNVSIAVLTDGEDNYIDGCLESDNIMEYQKRKIEKIASIKQLINLLRGNGNLAELHLQSSVLIGLTSNDFSKNKLEEIKKELGFEYAISIDSQDEKSLRRAFKTVSTNALNI